VRHAPVHACRGWGRCQQRASKMGGLLSGGGQ
jgi:hypothetical protein